MLAADVPTKIQVPFAASAGGPFTRVVPVASQIGIQDGAASFETGFPPLNFQPVASGGVPPFGQDFNGLLNQISAWSRWQGAGGPVKYDATFQAAVGGYPTGAVVASATTFGTYWISTVDSNVTNPDSGGAGWLGFRVISTPSTITGTSTTYTSAQNQTQIFRSNAGTQMIDALPGTGSFLQADTIIDVMNADQTALLIITPGAGATLTQGTILAGSLVLGPGQSATIYATGGSAYYVLRCPDRIRLSGPQTIYISGAGSDSNNGLNSGAPLATIQQAFSNLIRAFDIDNQVVTILLAGGTYTANVTISGTLVGQATEANLVIHGDVTTPANVLISPPTGNGIQVQGGAKVTVQGLRVSAASVNGNSLYATGPGTVLRIGGNMSFTDSGNANMLADRGALISIASNYNIDNANANIHYSTTTGGQIFVEVSITVALTSVPSYTTAFASALNASSQYLHAVTFSGSATGKKFNADLNSVISTGTSNVNKLPGNSAGTTQTGAQYN